MDEQCHINKKAWNYRAYEFWFKHNGSPEEYASKMQAHPETHINARYKDLLVNLQGKHILNPLGSNGRKAVPLALLGANVTIIDISENNKQYAVELAESANVHLTYIVADFLSYHNTAYDNQFDIVFCEGGILHYFHDLNPFFNNIARYLKTTGTLICNDFHPYRKILFPEIGTHGNYFDKNLHSGPVAYEFAFDKAEQQAFPKCLLRYYTMGEIITAIGKHGLYIQEMREIHKPDMENIPGEFTVVAKKL